MPRHGTSPATPRAENAPVEQRHIVRLGSKTSSTAHKAKNLTRDERETEEATPNKRQRTTVNQKVSSAVHRGSKLGRDQEKASGTTFIAYRTITVARDGEEQNVEEEGPFRSQKALPVRIDRKVSSSAYNAKNLVHDEQEEEEGRPSKKSRTLSLSPSVSSAWTHVGEVETTARRKTPPHSTREEILAMKMARRRAAIHRSMNWNTSEPVKRKRGRPRLSSPRLISKTKVKIEELQVDIPVVAQPRATNGRFGKKDKSWRKSHEYTAVGSTVADDDDDDVEPKSPRRKRGIDAVQDFEEVPKKRSASEQNPNSGNDVEVVGSGQKVLPRPASGFRGGRLFSNPNPLRFALYAWAGPLILDESSDDDEKQPETPEDSLSSVADIAPTEEITDSMFLPSSILPRAPPLTCKPSPFVFAKNRWNATSTALNKVVDNNRRSSTSSSPSHDKLRSNLRTSHASLEEEVILLFALQKVFVINTYFFFFRSPDFPLLIVRTYVPCLKVILPRCGPMTKPTCPNCDTCILCSLLLLHL